MPVNKPQNFADANDILLEDYLPRARELYNSSTILRMRLRRKKVEVGGRDFNYGIKATRNEAVGGRVNSSSVALSSMPALPTAGSLGYDAAKFKLVNLYAGFIIAGDVIASSNKAALVSTLDEESKAVTKRLAEEENLQAFGLGTHAVAKIASGGGTGTLVLTNTYPWSGNKYIRTGMRLTPNPATNDSGVQLVVASVNADGVTITVTAEASSFNGSGSPNVNQSANDDLLFYGEARGAAGSATAESFGAGLFGLIAGIETRNPRNAAFGAETSRVVGGDPTGLYGNIDRSTAGNEFWQGNVSNGADNAGAATGTIEMMHRMMHAADIAQQGNIDLIVTTHALLRQYCRGVSRQWNDMIKTIDRGYKMALFNGVEVVADRHCPTGTMFFLDSSSWDWCYSEDINFQDYGGAVLERATSSVGRHDAWQGQLVAREQLACNNPGKNALIYGLSEQTAFTQ